MRGGLATLIPVQIFLAIRLYCSCSSVILLPFDSRLTLIRLEDGKRSGRVQLDQFYFCNPVALKSICYCTRAKRLINKANTTGGLRKIWTGERVAHPIPILFCDSVLLETICHRTKVNQLIYESTPEKKWPGLDQKQCCFSIFFHLQNKYLFTKHF